MVVCSIRCCQSRSVLGGTTMFFSFPTKESVANEWLRYCGPKTTIKNGTVCSNHFLSSDYIMSLKTSLNESPRIIRRLKPDALPTQQIYYMPNSTSMEITNGVDTSGNIKCLPCECNTTPVRGIAGSGNIKCIPDECNTTPVREIAGSGKIMCISDECNTTPVNGIAGSGNIKCIPDECNATPVDGIAGSTNVVEKSHGTVTIPLAEYKRLQETANEFDVLKNNLQKMFTAGQIRCLMKPNRRRVRWSAEDIAAAISLLKRIRPKCYRHLRATVRIPLPGFSTLRKWESKFETRTFINVEEFLIQTQEF